ncbi:hypothetical protein BpHYR1_021601 [Brachionus plicatilis]|uniref:Uncharacterized protein n=1 Tax=Brachionus plicatilis TaxID=10195 RepID=A0A3M7Q1E6_BRAPC|nr:hypothetical protein BpHYR1_021601 [Brachionus plicatilis]
MLITFNKSYFLFIIPITKMPIKKLVRQSGRLINGTSNIDVEIINSIKTLNDKSKIKKLEDTKNYTIKNYALLIISS